MSSAEHGPGAGSGRLGEAPWQLGAAGLVWLVFGIMELVLAIDLGGSRAVSGQQAEQIRTQVGADAVPGGEASVSTVPLVLGILIIIATLLLAVRRGWARQVLVLLGLLAVLDLAYGGQWPAVLAMVLLVLGTTPMMSVALHRYVSGGTRGTAGKSGSSPAAG